MARTLFILDDPPYGSERCNNALRLAVGRHGGETGVCATCMDARGIADEENHGH